MELNKYEKISSLKLFKYTQEQLLLKEKIELGIVLDDNDYQLLYYDLLDEFGDIQLECIETDESVNKLIDSIFNKDLESEGKIAHSIYVDYLNRKYNCTFKESTIKKVILDQLNKKKACQEY